MAQLITPFLWFDTRAEDAAKHYTAIFSNSRILKTARYPKGAPAPEGSVMTVDFELDGQRFTALNAGPHFRFTEAVSFVVSCKNQEEVDYYWSKLSAGGEEGPCGWLKDKFGLSWQVVPTALAQLLSDKDSTKTGRVMQAVMTMKKLDVAALERAYDRAPGAVQGEN